MLFGVLSLGLKFKNYFTIKFSICGRLFATAGQDNIVRVWVLRNYLNYFTRMRERYSQDSQGNMEEKSRYDIENLLMQDDLVSILVKNIFVFLKYRVSHSS